MQPPSQILSAESQAYLTVTVRSTDAPAWIAHLFQGSPSLQQFSSLSVFNCSLVPGQAIC